VARELATQLLGQSEAIGNLFGARLAHQLAGIAALTDGDADTALAELAQANQQRPTCYARRRRQRRSVMTRRRSSICTGRLTSTR